MLENKALYKYFGYGKQQIIETLYYTALQRNHSLELNIDLRPDTYFNIHHKFELQTL